MWQTLNTQNNVLKKQSICLCVFSRKKTIFVPLLYFGFSPDPLKITGQDSEDAQPGRRKTRDANEESGDIMLRIILGWPKSETRGIFNKVIRNWLKFSRRRAPFFPKIRPCADIKFTNENGNPGKMSYFCMGNVFGQSYYYQFVLKPP